MDDLKAKRSFLPLTKSGWVIVHAISWVLLFVLLFVIFTGFLDPFAAFKRTTLLVLFLSGIFYFTAYVLVDQLLEKKRYWQFALAFVLFVVFVVKLKFQMDFVWLKDDMKLVRMVGDKTSRFVATFPLIFDLVFSTLFQLLFNHYKRARIYKARLAELTTAQLSLLKGQINPHFLFNNLNNIYSMVVRNDKQAPDMIIKLSDLLRYVIYQSANNKVSVNDELEQLKNLISLCTLKNEENKNIVFDTSHVQRQGFIEPMILIPLVENCFKHWNGAFDPKGYIKIEVSSDNKWFCFITENTHSETGVAKVKGEGGLGIENIKSRLELVYGDKMAFNIQRENNIFKVKLIIEWNN